MTATVISSRDINDVVRVEFSLGEVIATLKDRTKVKKSASNAYGTMEQYQLSLRLLNITGYSAGQMKATRSWQRNALTALTEATLANRESWELQRALLAAHVVVAGLDLSEKEM